MTGWTQGNTTLHSSLLPRDSSARASFQLADSVGGGDPTEGAGSCFCKRSWTSQRDAECASSTSTVSVCVVRVTSVWLPFLLPHSWWWGKQKGLTLAVRSEPYSAAAMFSEHICRLILFLLHHFNFTPFHAFFLKTFVQCANDGDSSFHTVGSKNVIFLLFFLKIWNWLHCELNQLQQVQSIKRIGKSWS